MKNKIIFYIFLYVIIIVDEIRDVIPIENQAKFTVSNQKRSVKHIFHRSREPIFLSAINNKVKVVDLLKIVLSLVFKESVFNVFQNRSSNLTIFLIVFSSLISVISGFLVVFVFCFQTSSFVPLFSVGGTLLGEFFLVLLFLFIVRYIKYETCVTITVLTSCKNRGAVEKADTNPLKL